MPATNTCKVPEQSSSVSTQCQLVSTQYQLSIKLAVYSKWQKLPCQVTLQENGFLAVYGADPVQSSQQTLWGRKGLGSVSVHLSLYDTSILKLSMTHLLFMTHLSSSKFRVDILFSNNVMILLQTSKQIRFSCLTSCTKSVEKGKPKLSCTYLWNLFKISPKLLERELILLQITWKKSGRFSFKDL